MNSIYNNLYFNTLSQTGIAFAIALGLSSSVTSDCILYSKPHCLTSESDHIKLEYANYKFLKSKGGTSLGKEFIQSCNTLDEIAELKYDWNGNGASPFSTQLISHSKQLLLNLCKQPMIFPTANDSIQFEYEKDDGDYLEFEIYENGEIKLFHLYPDNSYDKKTINSNDMNGEVEKFYGL